MLNLQWDAVERLHSLIRKVSTGMIEVQYTKAFCQLPIGILRGNVDPEISFGYLLSDDGGPLGQIHPPEAESLPFSIWCQAIIAQLQDRPFSCTRTIKEAIKHLYSPQLVKYIVIVRQALYEPELVVLYVSEVPSEKAICSLMAE